MVLCSMSPHRWIQRLVTYDYISFSWITVAFTRLPFRISWHLLFQQLLLINLHFLVVACGIVMMLFAQCFHTFCDVRRSGKKASNCRILFYFCVRVAPFAIWIVTKSFSNLLFCYCARVFPSRRVCVCVRVYVNYTTIWFVQMCDPRVPVRLFYSRGFC